MSETRQMTGSRGPAKPRAFTDADAQKFLRRGYDALRSKNYEEAGNCCVLVLKYRPKEVPAHFLIGLVSSEMEKWPMARQAFQNVVSLDDKHAAGWAQLARAFMMTGQYGNAEKAVEKSVALSPDDPLVQHVIGTVYSLIGDQVSALKWYDRACEKSTSALFELNRSKAYTFLGHFNAAEDSLKAIVSKHPDMGQAHWLLSRLKTAENRDHIQHMETQLESANPVSIPFFAYAIGKEYEDLEDWDAAFHAFEKGAKIKRSEIEYDEAAEIAIFKAFENGFTKEWLASKIKGCDDDAPIFVIGQPRTGTTLVERIISAHDEVESAGELQQFGMAIKRLAGIETPKPMTEEIALKAREIDPEKLGALYIESTRSMRGGKARFVDKLPVNYLYAPLIAAALPNAKIIHIVRDPMDSCFASYKQLFADAYYHSYKQDEMARHYIRYRRLMDHWRSILGDRMLDVCYEDVVHDLPEQASRIISFLGLSWQDNCANFHQQKGAVTTASAAQVREKAHTRSVGRWREYENHLTEMKTILEGVDLL